MTRRSYDSFFLYILSNRANPPVGGFGRFSQASKSQKSRVILSCQRRATPYGKRIINKFGTRIVPGDLPFPSV